MNKSSLTIIKSHGASIAMIAILLISLLPIILLGRYNHPTGDDYHYGAETRRVWEETQSVPAVIREAAAGVATQYQIWQGTYSAMFLMYLAPNIWGDTAYHMVTGALLLLLVSSIFYLLRQLLCTVLGLETSAWIATASGLAFLAVQTVPFAQESFFWYNGSMYYTGFFAITLFFFGLLCLYLKYQKQIYFIFLILLALFLAGGNYVSFLPALILTVTINGWLLWNKRFRPAVYLGIVNLSLVGGFAISALAPGNRIRQNDMWKIPALTAIRKSLFHGLVFLREWPNIWWVLTLLLLTPVLWKAYRKTTFSFRYPLLVIGYAYGVFCSMTCPTFYTMNSTGPARAAAIMYYGFILFVFFAYGYLLGYLQRRLARSKPQFCAALPNKCKPFVLPALTAVALTVALTCGSFSNLTALRAYKLLANGEAAAYEAEYQERLALLQDDTLQEVVFRPYIHRPDLLYVGDFAEDPNTPTNLKVAEYFHKTGVCVDWSE